MPTTFTAPLKRRARTLHSEGHGCNAIARAVGVSPTVISRWAKGEGLAFDRSQTDLATRAHVIDLRADAMLLAQKLIVAAHDELDRLEKPFRRSELGGEMRDEYIHLDLDRPPVEVAQRVMVSAAVAIDKALKVSTALDEGKDEHAESLVDALVDGFERVARAYKPAS